ncbi:flagellar basal-body rod protein FlgG [Porticoccus sp.]|jgi:flagellar basal-body rod protein FlgG|uniref:flagellar basal-body rod protein FlgG n=1 Tax=Porticoccus sp. TaxID=2024853 RepID=UPI000C3863B3|nr:flagellar basal-body rod protein FlgG [Porticoccus sp.]MAZ70651.1 flagellar basal-body rod protein FlgG [Porticoccus sp.]|tara:strand:+ start:4282 stop:5067 length:786 start_codon:yes stop_codon:yes gene_type:complete
MNQALWIAKTGLDAQQTKMSNIANNLANAGTTGYKRSRAIFEDLLYQNVRQVGAQSSQDTQLPSGLMIGTGVRVVATEKLFTQGNLAQTENMLDMAIQGRGFFQILLPDGTQAYTRDGSFQVDNQGQMVTSAGYILQPSVTLPENALSVNIGSDGTVSVRQPDSSAVSQVGTIQLADFVNPAGLQPIGENLFLESNASGSPQTGNPGLNGLGTVFQGYVESSNVNVVEELVNMIETQRTYEMNSKAISTTDQMLQYVASNL